MGDGSRPGVASGIAYALAVVEGREIVCELVKLAAKRFLSDLERAANGGPWSFNHRAAEFAIHFAGQMPNIKGEEGDKPLKLMPWQCFVYANLFGFMEQGTIIRRFRQGVVFVPRGNGKTTVSAPIAVYLTFMDREPGAEGYAAAVTRDQARILFDTAQEMVRRAPDFRKKMGVEVGAHTIFCRKTASKLTAISSDAKALDGLNVQVAICDEIGSHRTSEVYEVLLTALGKRRQPLLLSISTATGNNTGVGKMLWDYSVRVLEGKHEDERLFALLYTVDDGDDLWAEATWIKANPSWGVAVKPDQIRSIMGQAKNSPAQESAVKTRHMNIWVGADNALFSGRAWDECADNSLKLDDFEGNSCYIGVDLASKTDLAAVVLVFAEPDDNGKLAYTVFARCYTNEVALTDSKNVSYAEWAKSGALIVTSGNETDFKLIETDIRDLCTRFDVQQVSYDPWQSTQMAQHLLEDGVPMVQYLANTQNFSEPTKEVDVAIRSGRLKHDGNPVLGWCIGNVVGRYDARSNVYPKRGKDEQKIDAAIAMIMGVGVAIRGAENPPSVYESRGFLVL